MVMVMMIRVLDIVNPHVPRTFTQIVARLAREIE